MWGHTLTTLWPAAALPQGRGGFDARPRAGNGKRNADGSWMPPAMLHQWAVTSLNSGKQAARGQAADNFPAHTSGDVSKVL